MANESFLTEMVSHHAAAKLLDDGTGGTLVGVAVDEGIYNSSEALPA